jgi:uncharacterized membrane protein YeaQ/YmgE (transglycosylase-associated protein family)
MPFVLLALLIIVGLMIFFWVGANFIGLLLMLVVAGIVGWLADLLIPGNLPWGWLGAILAGLVGSWLGVWVLGLFGLGGVGPTLAGIPIIPAFVGATILALIADVVGKSATRSRAI